jgi:hypothetical protein
MDNVQKIIRVSSDIYILLDIIYINNKDLCCVLYLESISQGCKL